MRLLVSWSVCCSESQSIGQSVKFVLKTLYCVFMFVKIREETWRTKQLVQRSFQNSWSVCLVFCQSTRLLTESADARDVAVGLMTWLFQWTFSGHSSSRWRSCEWQNVIRRGQKKASLLEI